MNAQHSPGPWLIRGSTLYAANGDRIARMEPGGSVTISQDDANRRLIEAGPLLIDALRGLLDRYPEVPGTYTPEGAKARALLAKVEGSP